MKALSRRLVAPFLSLLLLLPLGSSSLAASSPANVRSHAGRMAAVTISITTTGTVWGKVTSKYTVKGRTTTRSCATATCTLRVPRGATLHLSQSPIDSSTWPFKDWKVTVNHRTSTMMGSAISVKVSGIVRVKAIYVVAGGSGYGSGSGSGGSGSGAGWP
ncbi:MAG TPA: hypothetical protein VFB58_11185 [Chloroflexota bacterium]|nr:hypothetical protein [Chloroflexota bacterium]